MNLMHSTDYIPFLFLLISLNKISNIYYSYRTSLLRGMTYWLWLKKLEEKKVGVSSLGVWLILSYLGDPDTAAGMANEDGEGWKTTEAPWENSDRDYTYEEVTLATTVLLIIALYCSYWKGSLTSSNRTIQIMLADRERSW